MSNKLEKPSQREFGLLILCGTKAQLTQHTDLLLTNCPGKGIGLCPTFMLPGMRSHQTLFGVYCVQEISKQQQDYFSQLSFFRHVLNIKLCLREEHCFVLIVTLKQRKGTIMGEHIHMQTYFENKSAKLCFIALPNYVQCSFYNSDILN